MDNGRVPMISVSNDGDVYLHFPAGSAGVRVGIVVEHRDGPGPTTGYRTIRPNDTVGWIFKGAVYRTREYAAMACAVEALAELMQRSHSLGEGVGRI